MTRIILLAAAALAGALASAPVRAQSTPDKEFKALYEAFEAKVKAAKSKMLHWNDPKWANDPQLVAAYQAGRCSSGLTFEQFVYKWAATLGCSAAGEGAWIEGERRLSRDRRQSAEAYWRFRDMQAAGAQGPSLQFGQYQGSLSLDPRMYEALPARGYRWSR